jgi:hypothetical protein
VKELFDQLTKQLGIDQNQAQSGAAILFKAAKDKLGGAEFHKLLGRVPGIDDLLKRAPAGGGGGGLLGGLASALGGNAAILANVVSGFTRLGLSAETGRKFVPIVLDFLRKHVDPEVIAKIEAALRA